MILRRITLDNFGVYTGVQSVCLCPEPGKNIILFGGKNGAGKSTLLEAVRLCFYGQYASKDLQAGESYDKYLLSRIHSDATAVIQPSSAAIEVEFDYAESGALQTYSVLRSWERKNGSARVAESFVLKKNGDVIKDLEAEHWQDFIRDLIPAGISQLFFFDGEKIQHLAEDETDQVSLAESIKALLGLDIIERLQADLTIYKSRNIKSNQIDGSAKLDEINSRVEELRSSLASVLADRDSVNADIQQLRGEVGALEQSISSHGGGFSKNRDRLMARSGEIRARIEVHEQTIRELSGSLLPFVISMPLCKELMTQLAREEELDASRAIKTKVAKLRATFASSLKRPKGRRSPLGSSAKRGYVEPALTLFDKAVSSVIREPNVKLVHRVSVAERDQIGKWVQEAQQIAPGLSRIASELEQLYRELQRCQRDLARVPSDEVLKPLIEQLGSLHARLGQCNARFSVLDERARTINDEIDELQRRFGRETDEIASRAKSVLNLERASEIQAALEEYKDRLLRKKVSELQEAITECFNLLSRKKDSVRSVRIDPSNFSVRLQDRNQRPLAKAELSAGEKQIYAVAVLWGLAKISGKPLPLIVDTPLARLDSDHRRLLAENYFPQASHQVIILSTDTEIDRHYFELLRKHVSKSYRLEYEPQQSGSTVKQGYFWDEAN